MIADSTDPFPGASGSDAQHVRADQLEPEDGAVLGQSDRDAGGECIYGGVERPDDGLQRVVDQEPQLDQMPALPDRPDPAVLSAERRGQPVRDGGVVLDPLPGQHPQPDPIHRPRGANT